MDCTILASGALDESWSDRLGGLRVRPSAREADVSELTGRLLDQAALLGVLVTLYDLGLPLISVACREARVPAGARVRAALRAGPKGKGKQEKEREWGER
jgi:hypothetical protein